MVRPVRISHGPRFYSFSDSLLAAAGIYSKGNTQAHESIEGLKRSIAKIERRMKVAVSQGNMLQTMKLALLLKEQSMKLQSEVDRFVSENNNMKTRQGKPDGPRVLERLDAPDRNQRQLEETNGSRKIRVKAVSKKV